MNKFIKNIINGKWQIYEEDNENRYIYYTQMSFTYSYGELSFNQMTFTPDN